MKRIALINSYCNSKEKIDVLLENINILKFHGLDVMLYSPLVLPNEVIELCNYFIYNKENKILHFPEKGVYTYNVTSTNDKQYIIKKMLKDYGWASIYQVKKLSDIALTFDYTHFYHIIYDLVIDEAVIKNILSEKSFNFFKFHEHEVSLHFMIFNRENLLKFIPYLTLENYLSDKSNIAESWLHQVVKSNSLDCILEDEYVDDKIFYYGKDDQFNCSPIEGLKFFIEKDYYNSKNIKLYFYDLPNPTEIKINIIGRNQTHQNYKVENRGIIDLGINYIDDNEIEVNGYNITNEIKDVVHNTLEINNIHI
jgi:hypothetical protein